MKEVNEDVHSRKWMFYAMNNVLYFSWLLPVIYLFQYIPSMQIEDGSWLYEFIYYRPYYWTDYLSVSKFVTWMFLLVAGFTFVNVSNLNGERSSIFMSRDGSFKDIKGLIKLGAILFFVAPIIFLRGKYDLDEYCNVSPVESV